MLLWMDRGHIYTEMVFIIEVEWDFLLVCVLSYHCSSVTTYCKTNRRYGLAGSIGDSTLALLTMAVPSLWCTFGVTAKICSKWLQYDYLWSMLHHPGIIFIFLLVFFLNESVKQKMQPCTLKHHHKISFCQLLKNNKAEFWNKEQKLRMIF